MKNQQPPPGQKQPRSKVVALVALLAILGAIVFTLLAIASGDDGSQSGSNSQGPLSPAARASLPEEPATRSVSWREVTRYPHDSNAFTQGLIYRNGAFWESTGLYEESNVRRVRVVDGSVLQQTDNPADEFGEGLTYRASTNTLLQLTWKKGVLNHYNADTLALTQSTSFTSSNGEGWGLTNDDRGYFYCSDGTNVIVVWHPDTLEEVRRFSVTNANGGAVDQLNELEWVDGELWANVWLTDTVVRINPVDGSLLGVVDFAALNQNIADENVMNGLAYDAVTNKLYLTGKLWRNMFELQLTWT